VSDWLLGQLEANADRLTTCLTNPAQLVLDRRHRAKAQQMPPAMVIEQPHGDDNFGAKDPI